MTRRGTRTKKITENTEKELPSGGKYGKINNAYKNSHPYCTAAFRARKFFFMRVTGRENGKRGGKTEELLWQLFLLNNFWKQAFTSATKLANGTLR
jgi:hypothetical protein